MLDFLGVEARQFSLSALSTSSGTATAFSGSVLPEAQSHLPFGFKVVSFYVSAGAIIRRAYVLRRDSWRVGSNIYQRILQKKKIDSIRRHLLAGKGVFLNNIIVALPESTKILELDDNQADTKKIFKVTPVKVQLTEDFNSVSIIDGQHRIFSYYEGGIDEIPISVLRDQQNLLVTGIVMPSTVSTVTRNRFAASLFLQVNSTQTNTRPELIQDIGVIVRPFAVASVARRLLWKINERGPFTDQFQTAFAEGEKVKTASVVNYGLSVLIRPGSEESLYTHWQDSGKLDLVSGQTDETVDEAVIERYVDFCTVEINKFSGAFKMNLEPHRWTASRKVPDRVLTTTIVNGMIHCLRRLCTTNNLSTAESYKKSLAGIKDFDFSQYTSSHYAEMGTDLAKKYFGV